MACLPCNLANRSKLLAASARTLVPLPVYPVTVRVWGALVLVVAPKPAPLVVFFFGLAYSCVSMLDGEKGLEIDFGCDVDGR